MRTELPDVNVLLALLDPMHPHHSKAQNWYAAISSAGWATCPLTENGFVRVLSSPAYAGLRLRTEDALALLSAATANSAAIHQFWPDTISLCDATLFLPAAIAGPKQITDVYLLGLCQQNNGTLVTLDTAITAAAIITPSPDLYRIL